MAATKAAQRPASGPACPGERAKWFRCQEQRGSVRCAVLRCDTTSQPLVTHIVYTVRIAGVLQKDTVAHVCMAHPVAGDAVVAPGGGLHGGGGGRPGHGGVLRAVAGALAAGGARRLCAGRRLDRQPALEQPAGGRTIGIAVSDVMRQRCFAPLVCLASAELCSSGA